MSTEAELRTIWDKDVVCVLEHKEGSRLKMWFHAAHQLAGGDRSSSSAADRRSIRCMSPPQSGHFQRECGRGAAGARLAGARCLSSSRRKQTGSSCDRCRLARKPKWRMRTNPGGNKCSRNRRRNSSTERVMMRLRLSWAESRQRKLTLPLSRAINR
jgi:hypothetical protein